MKRIAAIILAFSMLFLCGCTLNADFIKQKAEALLSGNKNSAVGNFVFTDENYPKIANTLSTMPLGVTFTSTALGISENEAEKALAFTGSTKDCCKALCDGEADIVIAYAPDKETEKYAAKKNVEFEMTPICLDALVFICSKNNKATGLTAEQVKNIYSGKITSWKDVGGAREDLTAYQRPQGSDSKMLFDRIFQLGDRLMQAPKDIIINSSADTAGAVSDYDNSDGALGYTVYYYLNNMDKEKLSGTKMLSIDGVSPTKQTISDGTYPLSEEIYVIIKSSSEKESSERILYNWICSSQGNEIIDKLNYPCKIYTKNQ